jgi:hypothetical protein
LPISSRAASVASSSCRNSCCSDIRVVAYSSRDLL